MAEGERCLAEGTLYCSYRRKKVECCSLNPAGLHNRTLGLDYGGAATFLRLSFVVKSLTIRPDKPVGFNEPSRSERATMAEGSKKNLAERVGDDSAVVCSEKPNVPTGQAGGIEETVAERAGDDGGRQQKNLAERVGEEGRRQQKTLAEREGDDRASGRRSASGRRTRVGDYGGRSYENLSLGAALGLAQLLGNR